MERDTISDAEVERMDEQAREAAIHASSPGDYMNPYRDASLDKAVLFDHYFRQHYARENGK